eukprot:Nk52_evm5s343 gene=Nk52_evmTU5s343
MVLETLLIVSTFVMVAGLSGTSQGDVHARTGSDIGQFVAGNVFGWFSFLSFGALIFFSYIEVRVMLKKEVEMVQVAAPVRPMSPVQGAKRNGYGNVMRSMSNESFTAPLVTPTSANGSGINVNIQQRQQQGGVNSETATTTSASAGGATKSRPVSGIYEGQSVLSGSDGQISISWNDEAVRVGDSVPATPPATPEGGAFSPQSGTGSVANLPHTGSSSSLGGSYSNVAMNGSTASGTHGSAASGAGTLFKKMLNSKFLLPKAPKQLSEKDGTPYKTKYEYNAQDEYELSFPASATVYVLDKSNPSWWLCIHDGMRGYISALYLVTDDCVVDGLDKESSGLYAQTLNA